MHRALFPCLLLLTACSAEVAVETQPFNQTVPVTSILQPVYAEVAIDVPDEAVGPDIHVEEISTSLTIVNPTKSLTLEAGARLSFKGQATPDNPVLYTATNLPAYFNEAFVLLPTQSFTPGETRPVTITDPVLVQAAGKKRIWIIVNNTVKQVGIGTDTLPVNILLKDIIFRATVTKYFPNVGGALEVGGM
ncbi:MAG: hypothetical protein ACJ8AT_17210 [Hyalangium sp.]|uniref:hypothetical protein n=1 Tax=Hyalangium sp. TaxID=2028555 RepID=UPI0038998A72